MLTSTGATATAVWPAMATRTGAAHASKAVTGSARALRSAVRAAAVSGNVPAPPRSFARQNQTCDPWRHAQG
eukprot:77128-Pleurochrysis_carterae.AAC.1